MEVTCADYVPAHLQRASELGFSTVTVDLDGDSDKVAEASEACVGEFDVVVCLAAIEHIFNSDNVFGFVHKILRPGGSFIVNTPNMDFAGYRLYSALSGNRPCGDGHHIRFWNYRFLNINLFLNGFAVTGDYRRFYALPVIPLERALRGRRLAASLISRVFNICFLTQHMAGLRGRSTDELTLLASREDEPVVGFELPLVQRRMAEWRDTDTYGRAAARLRRAKEKGWLAEHINLSRFVDSL